MRILNKVEIYLHYETRLVWVVYPDEEVVDVCRLAEGGGLRVQKVEMDGTLDGEDVLPGFRLPVRSVFPKGD